MDYLYFLYDCVIYLALITVIIGTFSLKKFNSKRILCFVLFLWFRVVFDFIMYYGLVGTDNNLGFYNVLDLIGYNFLIFFFSQLEQKNKRNGFGLFSIIVFNLAVFLESIFTESLWTKNLSYSFTVGSLLLLITIFLFISRILKTEVVINIKKHLLVWLGFGVLFFTVVEIPLVAITNYFEEIGRRSDYLMITRAFANIIMYSLFCIGFFIAKEE